MEGEGKAEGDHREMKARGYGYPLFTYILMIRKFTPPVEQAVKTQTYTSTEA